MKLMPVALSVAIGTLLCPSRGYSADAGSKLTYITNAVIVLDKDGCAAVSNAVMQVDHFAPKIIKQPPEDLFKEAGTHLDLRVDVVNPKQPDATLAYQWTLNGSVMAGKTNDHICVGNVSIASVATYRAIVFGPGGSNSTHDINLHVYSLYCTNSNGGTLTSPIGSYSGGANSCQGASFNYYHTYFPFEGPHSSLTTTNFPNTSGGTNFTVDTFSLLNGTVDTGILLSQNFGFGDPIGCTNNSVPPSPITNTTLTKYGKYKMKGTASDSTYRVTILYKTPLPPGQTNVTFNWLYE